MKAIGFSLNALLLKGSSEKSNFIFVAIR
jgi:hypothetical protein